MTFYSTTSYDRNFTLRKAEKQGFFDVLENFSEKV